MANKSCARLAKAKSLSSAMQTASREEPKARGSVVCETHSLQLTTSEDGTPAMRLIYAHILYVYIHLKFDSRFFPATARSVHLALGALAAPRHTAAASPSAARHATPPPPTPTSRFRAPRCGAGAGTARGTPRPGEAACVRRRKVDGAAPQVGSPTNPVRVFVILLIDHLKNSRILPA